MIALSVLLPLLSPKTKGVIAKNDHLIYSVTGTMGTKNVQGALGIKVVAVKENEFVVEVMPKGVPFMNRARLTFPGDGEDLSDLGGIICGWSTRYDGQRLGSERITTPFGEREVEHYMRIEELENGTLKTDQYVELLHRLPIGARLSGKSGDVLFGLVETSLGWIKEKGKG